jgi:uncharacterized membrane protein
MTFVLFGATFNLSYRFVIWQVIWAIGWSMVALSVLIYLPRPALLLFSVAMIAGHNLLDGISSAHMTSLGWMWKILHEGFAPIALRGGTTAIVVYPLIPWIGVMSGGYCFGRVFDLPPAERRSLMLRVGAGLTAAFVVLRWANVYGDPSAWSAQSTSLMTFLSFLRTSKYPPSLLYLLMALGPSIFALGALERVTVGQRNPLLVFGRVPLFYYVVHWYLLHLVAIALAWLRYGRIDFMFGLPAALSLEPTRYPSDYGYPLLLVYLVWAAIVGALYPLCRWFAGVKARHRSPLLSYL